MSTKKPDKTRRLSALIDECSSNLCSSVVKTSFDLLTVLISKQALRWLVNHHEIKYSHRSSSEVKVALKELKLAKRGISNVKREIMEAKRVLRAKYTNTIRKRDSFTDWLLYKPSPAARRKILADDLAPLESEQRTLENLRIQVEQSIVQLEGWLMKSES